jgi:hypothetical protein
MFPAAHILYIYISLSLIYCTILYSMLLSGGSGAHSLLLADRAIAGNTMALAVDLMLKDCECPVSPRLNALTLGQLNLTQT